ncbi:recombinase family protein [Streptomyces sp. NPDC088785]|uniref:recombinase family protein n=1 Tax=Streptomyces sp. NPDC088785 TaxID=3365897 RepID=UPI003820C5F7
MTKALTGALDVIEKTTRPQVLRAVDYLRVSTEEQVKGYGISYTGKSTARYIKKKGWVHVDTFTDEAKSGTLSWQERWDAKKLMELAHQEPRPFDMVVVEETRAIGREDRAFFRWYWELEDLGIFVAVVEEDLDTSTESGRTRMLDKANESFKELVKIRKRTQGGIQDKAEEGGYTGGKVRYGYRIENQGKVGESRLVVDECAEGEEPEKCEAPHEGCVLRRGRQLFIEYKGDKRKTVVQLNAERKFNRSGNPWSVQTFFDKILNDDLLEGRLIWRNPSRVHRKRGVKVDADGRPLYGETVTIQLPRIFTPAEVKELRAVAELSMVTRAPAVSHGVYTLSKRIVSPCGSIYTGFGRKGSDVRYYRCKMKDPRFPGGPICSCAVLGASAAEQRVWREVADFLGDAERLEALVRKWLGTAEKSKVDYPARIAGLDQQIEEQNDIIAATEGAAVARAIRRGMSRGEAVDAAAKAVLPLEGVLADLEKQRAEAEAWQKEALVVEERVDSMRRLAAQAKGRLDTLEDAQRKVFFAVLKVKVTVLANPEPVRSGARCSLLKWFASQGRSVPHLTDQAWARVREIAEDRAYRKLTARQILGGLLYKARTGCRWPELPEEFGNNESVKTYWRRWAKNGTWERIMDRLADEPGVPPYEGLTPLPPMHIEGELFSELLLDAERHLGQVYLSASAPLSS